MKIGIDLTAAWRPRVGMVTVSIELTRALLDADPADAFTVFAARERPRTLEEASAQFVLSPHRNEVVNKLHWLPAVVPMAHLDAMLYPFWPPSPRRSREDAPAVVYVHDLAFRLRPDEVPWQQRAYLGTVLPRALRHAAAVVCPSQATAGDLVSLFPIDGLSDRVHMVSEGPTPLPPPSANLPKGVRPGFLLAVGTVERRKNYGRLVEAYRLLRDPPQLVIAGDFPSWGDSAAHRLLSRTEGVVVLGRVDDATLARLYSDARAFLFPSLYEGFGLPLLDALAAGVPSLVTNSGALHELAAGAALEVDPYDVDALADGMDRLLRDESLRSRLKPAGPKRAAEFSWSRTGQTVHELLRAAANRESATA